MVRDRSPVGYSRASYELNLGCNYDCEHCYLGLKRFRGLDWADRQRLLHMLRDAGVLYLQLTGGEPLIDRYFSDVYGLAFELGMMLQISSNGSRLHHTPILDLLTTYRPYRVTLSVYGASEDSYDSLTRRPGSFRKFMKGLAAGVEAGLPLRLNLVLTRTNTDDEAAMVALAEHYGLPYMTYSNISPTIHGGGEVLPSQSAAHLRERKPFTGCNAGHTFFHAYLHPRRQTLTAQLPPRCWRSRVTPHGIEVTSIDIEDLLHRFARLRSSNYTPDSLATYKTRFRKAHEYYLTYLQDPGNFRPRQSIVTSRNKKAGRAPRAKKAVVQPSDQIESERHDDVRGGTATPAAMEEIFQYPFRLRSGQTAYLHLPPQLHRSDVDRLIRLLESLVMQSETEESAAG